MKRTCLYISVDSASALIQYVQHTEAWSLPAILYKVPAMLPVLLQLIVQQEQKYVSQTSVPFMCWTVRATLTSWTVPLSKLDSPT